MWGLRNPMPATAGREAEEWIAGMRLTFADWPDDLGTALRLGLGAATGELAA